MRGEFTARRSSLRATLSRCDASRSLTPTRSRWRPAHVNGRRDGRLPRAAQSTRADRDHPDLRGGDQREAAGDGDGAGVRGADACDAEFVQRPGWLS
jgi:hypothetical protein